MNFTCQRPQALYAMLLIIPAVIIAAVQYRRLVKRIKTITVKDSGSVQVRRLKTLGVSVVLRSVFLALGWILLVLAYAGFSWGTYLEPVQKSGSSVSMVFDISYSMNAEDAPGSLTRLEAAKRYAAMLLSHIESTSLSVVIAKGDGVVVVPLTEDRAVVESLLESLSPALMTTGGSSLGKGIRAALKSFPANSSGRNSIWVFTDGDETDGLLEGALMDAVRTGISVYLIGFGTERETKVLAGDGKTYVMTALRLERMKAACANAMKKNYSSNISELQIAYVDATEPGSALQLLEPLKSNARADLAFDEGEKSVSYEVKPVQRYPLFLGLAIIFFVLSFVVMELNPDGISERIHKSNAVMLVLLPLIFTSCTNRVTGAKTILDSTWSWYQHRYNDSIAGYLRTACDAQTDGDELLEQYALYDLAVTYLSQNENNAAMERFRQINLRTSAEVGYATSYNCGIIAYRSGDYNSAAYYFKEALRIDGSKLDAKVNLELSLKNAEKEAKAKENAISQVSESNTAGSMERAVFERIREYDKKQWKNSENSENSGTASDY